ncbi:unnamed protein product [Urochloa humidicola]
MAAAEARVRQEKVRKYEEFVDRRLKPDLAKAIAQRDRVFEQQKTFLDLKRNIENLERNGVTSMQSMVNIGSEVYMQAEVPDTRHIFVDIGLGFHVEFTWQEALQFISVREARLARQIDEYTHLIATIKAQIKYVKASVNCCSYHRRKSCHLGIPGRIWFSQQRIGAIKHVKCSAILQDGSHNKGFLYDSNLASNLMTCC